ncbi:MAG: glycosyltransferase [Caulobacteraceae bacterium]
MTSFADRIFRRARRAARRLGGGPGLSKVVFVCYGPFDCNSAGHIAGFAAQLAALGYRVGVAARGPVDRAYAFGEPAFEPLDIDDLAADPAGAVAFDGVLEPARTLLAAWTPRKNVRRAVARTVKRLGIPYVVHFEDNEDHLATLRPGPDDAAARAAFVAGAAGLSYIAPRLAEVLPTAAPRILLEPGVDHAAFSRPLGPWRRAALLRAAGGAGGRDRDRLSGQHPPRQRRGDGRALPRSRPFARPGPSGCAAEDRPGRRARRRVRGLLARCVIALGHVERPFLLELMKCADLFVQPGAPGPFNDYRLPSKLPEFMAIGRPVILPAANVGLSLRDGTDALLLHDGSAAEIAARIEKVLDDPILAVRIGGNGQAFARRTWDWPRQGRRLAAFLERVHRSARALR